MIQSTLIYTLATAALASANPNMYYGAGYQMPAAEQSIKTMDIVPSKVKEQPTTLGGSSNGQCVKKQVTVVNTVTVTMAPPPEMSDETSFSYMTLSPSETVTIVNTDTTTTTSSDTSINTDTTSADNTQGNNDNASTNTKTDTGTSTTTPPPANTNTRDTENPTSAIPVSRAGGTLNPSAAAEANAFDKTAVRAMESVNIRGADGRCLAIDPTGGDFRQNLIPVQLAPCSEDSTQKFDVVTKGKHNDAQAGEALLVSVLMNGCLSFDARRQAGDTVTMFSCGGRADGGGETDKAQLFPFGGSNDIVLQPDSGNGKFCLVEGKTRLESGDCDSSKDQVFEIVEVLESSITRR